MKQFLIALFVIVAFSVAHAGYVDQGGGTTDTSGLATGTPIYVETDVIAGVGVTNNAASIATKLTAARIAITNDPFATNPFDGVTWSSNAFAIWDTDHIELQTKTTPNIGQAYYSNSLPWGVYFVEMSVTVAIASGGLTVQMNIDSEPAGPVLFNDIEVAGYYSTLYTGQIDHIRFRGESFGGPGGNWIELGDFGITEETNATVPSLRVTAADVDELYTVRAKMGGALTMDEGSNAIHIVSSTQSNIVIGGGTADAYGGDARCGVAIGNDTDAYRGVAIGNDANGADLGAAVGVEANAWNSAVALGYRAIANSYGTALGTATFGDYGVAVGRNANGKNAGIAVGAYANAGAPSYVPNYGLAIGAYSEATNQSGAAIGHGVTNKMAGTTAIRGELYMDGGTGFSYRVADNAGPFYHVPFPSYCSIQGTNFTISVPDADSSFTNILATNYNSCVLAGSTTNFLSVNSAGGVEVLAGGAGHYKVNVTITLTGFNGTFETYAAIDDVYQHLVGCDRKNANDADIGSLGFVGSVDLAVGEVLTIVAGEDGATDSADIDHIGIVIERLGL